MQYVARRIRERDPFTGTAISAFQAKPSKVTFLRDVQAIEAARLGHIEVEIPGKLSIYHTLICPHNFKPRKTLKECQVRKEVAGAEFW
jgi:hypothetical protein